MLYNKIKENGIYIDLYKLDSPPTIEVDGEWVENPSYISEPIPNDIYVSEGHPPKWTGTEWIATAEPPEPTPQPPTVEERLETAENTILSLLFM